MTDAQRRTRRPGRWRAAVAVLAILTGCSGGEPREAPADVVARAAVAVRDGRYDEALGLLDRIEERGDAPAAVVSIAQDQRLIAFAGLRRRDEMLAAGRTLADRRGGLEIVLAARAALAWLDAGGAADELEPLFAQVDRGNPYDGKELRQAIAARAEGPAAGSTAECLFCRKPGCDMDCVQHMTCVLCPAPPKP